MKELDKLDPNDSVRLTILVQLGDENEQWVETKVNEMQKWVDDVYFRILSTRTGTLYTIDTKARNFEQSEFKKFVFQAKLKFAENFKIR